MDTKLTLSLDETVISKAKQYAKKNKTSLSSLIENYLGQLTRKEKATKEEISPLVKDLIGVIKRPISKKQRRDEYTDYLKKKYN